MKRQHIDLQGIETSQKYHTKQDKLSKTCLFINTTCFYSQLGVEEYYKKLQGKRRQPKHPAILLIFCAKKKIAIAIGLWQVL